MTKKRQTIDEYRQILAGVSETDFIRLAAYIDGEGCISISQVHRVDGRSRSISQNLNLVISNTNVPFITWLKQTFAGSVYFVKYEKCKHLGKKQTMRWQINDRKAEAVLSRCQPYMIIKRSQAEVGLAFMKLKRTVGVVAGAKPLTEYEIEQRTFMHDEIQRLNQHGGAVTINYF
jgi:hypothetical protein